MKIKTSKQFNDLCARESEARSETGDIHPWVQGQDFKPSDLFFWVKPCTVADWIACHDTITSMYATAYTIANGNALTLARILHVNPNCYRLSKCTDANIVYTPGSTVPWFNDINDSEGLSLPGGIVKWADPESAKFAKLWAAVALSTVNMSLVNDMVEHVTEDLTPQQWRDLGETHGRWVKGLFMCEPNAELYIQECDVSDLSTARRNSTSHGRNGAEMVNQARQTAYLVSRIVRDSPNGNRFVSEEMVEKMQFGACIALMGVAQQMGTFRDGTQEPRCGLGSTAKPTVNMETERVDDVVGSEVSS